MVLRNSMLSEIDINKYIDIIYEPINELDSKAIYINIYDYQSEEYHISSNVINLYFNSSYESSEHLFNKSLRIILIDFIRKHFQVEKIYIYSKNKNKSIAIAIGVAKYLKNYSYARELCLNTLYNPDSMVLYEFNKIQ